MYSVNRYNTNDLVVLLKLLDEMLEKFEAEENSDFENMLKLIKNILKNATENLGNYKESLENINNERIIKDIKPLVSELGANIIKHEGELTACQSIFKYLDDYVIKNYLKSLGKIEELLKNGDWQKEWEKNITKLLDGYFNQIKKEFNTYEGDVDDLVEKRFKSAVDVDKDNKDKILEEIPKLPPKIVEIRPVLIDERECP